MRAEQPEPVSEPHRSADPNWELYEVVKTAIQKGVRGVSSGQWEIEFGPKVHMALCDALRAAPDREVEEWRTAVRRSLADVVSRNPIARLPQPAYWIGRLPRFLPPRPKPEAER